MAERKGEPMDLIERQKAIDALDAVCDRECEYSKQQRSVMCGACRLGSAFDVIDELPSAQPEDWMERNKERILQAGMEGREIEFRIGGRLFAIREKAQ